MNISARHGHLAQETQDKITQKIEKLAKYHGRISSVAVTIDLNRSETPDVEILVSIDKAENFISRVTANGGKLIGAVDAAIHKIEEQIKRYKEKKIDNHRNAQAKHQAMPEDDARGEL